MSSPNQTAPQDANLLRRISEKASSFFLAAIDVYGVFVLAYFLIRLLNGSKFLFVALCSHFLHILLLPAFLFLTLALYLRRWHSITLMSIAVFSFAWIYGPRFLPRSAPDNAAPGFTVMTFNIEFLNVSPDELVYLLTHSDADIIALQELADEQAVAIAKDLSSLYPCQILQGGGIPGVGLLSKYPCRDAEIFYLYSMDLPYLQATLTADGRELTLLNAHPPPLAGIISYRSNSDIAEEYKRLLDRIQSDNPFLLVGDFNTTDQSDNYALIHATGLSDAYRQAGWGLGLTWPAGRYGNAIPAWFPKTNRLDYIWYSDDFIALDAWTGERTNSDHLPVFAELSWNK
ncbi:MAG: endonuclease/exonuclease/phosphatase family protein [Anaerolineales bacterium]|nr:endonuclease/exonuclease/phosphatase family protein [Anaerolineales bacterium]